MSGTPDGKGGTTFTMIDTDPVLTAGTTWSYFETVNFAVYTPFAASPPSNLSGPVTIPGGSTAPTASFKIQLTYDNGNCVSGNNCLTSVYRATCSPTTANCPAYATQPALFTKLATTDTQTVTASNTHFVSLDSGAAPNPLNYNTAYAYAVTNAYTANPSQPGAPAQITLTTPSGVHSAILNFANTACRTTSPCTLQVYRATCTTSCPTYAPGNSAWKALNMSSGLVPTVGTQSTTWQYTDSDTALTSSTTYVWVATNSYTGASTTSPASSPWSGTTAQ